MKKNIAIALALFFVFSFMAINPAKADTLSNRLKGRILLQVESKGEAWYVNPKDGKRYYMANGDEAYNIMRNLGIGITNKDLARLQSNKNLAKKYAGKIFLQVESSGEAYYVDFNGNLHYLQNGAEAYKAMRDLGMGIKNSDLAKIKTNLDLDTDNSQSQNIKLKALSNTEIIKKVKPGVVYIETTDGAGSGMIIDSNGYVLTNAHVVAGFNSATIMLFDGQTKNAVVIGRDENVDLALLKMDTGIYSKVEFGNSDIVQQGEEVFTLGFPFGIKGDVSFKEGTISRKLNSDQGGYFETSAEIHPGNSGGPLVNKYGQVIGINSAGLGQSINGVSVGETIKLAIPINFAIKSLPDLKLGVNKIVPKQEANIASESNNEQVSPSSKSESSLSIMDNWYDDYFSSYADRLASDELMILGIIKNLSNTKSATNVKLKVTLIDSQTGVKQEEYVTLNNHKSLVCVVGKNCELVIESLQSAQFKEKIKIYKPFIKIDRQKKTILKSSVSLKLEVVSADFN